MRVINETAYRTDHLRTLIQRVLLEEVDPHQRGAYRFAVKYQRSNARLAGCAYYDRPVVTLYLKRPPLPQDRVALAHTVAHEIAHTKGWRHAQMKTPRYRYLDGWRELYAWAEALPLELSAPKAVPTAAQRLEAKLANAQAKLAQWERKERLARGRVRRWRGRVKDYTRYLERAAQKSPILLANGQAAPGSLGARKEPSQ